MEEYLPDLGYILFREHVAFATSLSRYVFTLCFSALQRAIAKPTSKNRNRLRTPPSNSAARRTLESENTNFTCKGDFVIPLPKGAPKTILLVEDNDAIRMLVQHILEQGGFEVLVASDAAAALQIEGHFPRIIHLLLSDVMMPGISGPELAAADKWPS